MEHATHGEAGSTILELSGALDVRRTSEVRARIYALLDGSAAPDGSGAGGDVVVDITEVDSIDMVTLRMLAVANRVAERQGRRVVLRGASPGVRRLLHFSHLRSRIPVEPSAGPSAR